MSDTINKVSSLVRSQLPAFYAEEGKNFIAFMEAYYEYMEQSGKMTDAIEHLQSYRDISTTTDDFIKHFLNTFLPSVPLDAFGDKKIMTKYVKYFNNARGTKASYRLLFRALYNEDIDFNYPAEQMLKVSAGDWRVDRYLVTSYDPNTYKFIGKTIVGTESTSEALVEDIIRRNIRGRDIMQILLSNIKGTFSNDEPIKVKGDTSATPHAPIAEAGIDGVTILSRGSTYVVGDVLSLVSSNRGKFAKVVVTKTEDLGGTLVYTINSGGSGYTPVNNNNTGTQIEFIGGDGNPEGSFTLTDSDITDTFAITINSNKVTANTVYGANAPTVTFGDGGTRKMTTFANLHIAAVDYGFPASNENIGNKDYHDQTNAAIVIANTSNPGVAVGDSLFGVTSGANAVVNIIKRAYNSTDVIVDVNGFQKFTAGEKINKTTASGTTIGTVATGGFYANAGGSVVLSVGYNANLISFGAGDNIVGMVSGQHGVVKKVLADTTGTQDYDQNNDGSPDWSTVTLKVTANNTSNTTNAFDTGLTRYWLEDEGIRKVGAGWVAANVVTGASNAQYGLTSTTAFTNVHTKLKDCLNFVATTFGTIAKVSLPVGGAGYSIAPTIRVRENTIAALGIGEAILTLQSDKVDFATGNSTFTAVDTNDGLVQANGVNGLAIGDIKQGKDGAAPATIQYANGTYETTVRVFQRPLNRDPGGIIWANNTPVEIKVFDSEYVPGEADSRTATDTGSAKIVKVEDRGVLGKNADISASVGANGTITGLRVIDSGFAYRDNEVVLVSSSGRTSGTSAQVRTSLGGVANAEGYYASTRGHLDSKRSFLQDSRFYQEFSYEIVSPVSLSRYRDVALQLVHPAGQALFGKYQLNSNIAVTTTSSTVNNLKKKSAGTVAITQSKASGTLAVTNNKYVLTGSSTQFANEFGTSGANTILVEIDPGNGIANQFIPVTIKANTATNALLTDRWQFATQTSANVYHANTFVVTGSGTALSTNFSNGSTIIIETSAGVFESQRLNIVSSATVANLASTWTKPNVSGANVYYQSGTR